MVLGEEFLQCRYCDLVEAAWAGAACAMLEEGANDMCVVLQQQRLISMTSREQRDYKTRES